MSELGIDTRAGYFAIRAAPLGRYPSAVVASAFHGFPVAVIRPYLPGIWDQVAPVTVIDAHHACLAATAARVFGDTIDVQRLIRVGDLLTEIITGLDTAGRPLTAGNQALVPPSEPWARLWHAFTTLREYRGEAHVAILVSAESKSNATPTSPPNGRGTS